MEQVSPTRMALLEKKGQIVLATKGTELLKNKRDALVREFFSVVDTFVNARSRLEQVSHQAAKALLMAEAIDGREVVVSSSYCSKREVFVEMTKKIIWGVRVPDVKLQDVRRDAISRGYSPIGVSARINSVSYNYELILNLIIEIASVEIHLKRLGNEIKKTTKRINALEQNLIPELVQQVRYIRDTLEERAREDTFRLKRLKKKSLKAA